MNFNFELEFQKSQIQLPKSKYFSIITAKELKKPLLSLYITHSSLLLYNISIKTNETVDLVELPEPSCFSFCFPSNYRKKSNYYLRDLIMKCHITGLSDYLRVLELYSPEPPLIYFNDIFKEIKEMFKTPQKPNIISNISNKIISYLPFNYKNGLVKFYKYGRVGSGAFGYVELVGTEPNNQASAKYCIKFFTFPNNEEKRIVMIDQLINEISALNTLSHTNLVDFLQAFIKKDSENRPLNVCLLMNYCNQGNLEDYIISHGPLKEDLAMDFLSQLLKGLQYLHCKKLNGKIAPYFHGDLKPKNILLHKPEDFPNRIIIKIADFGCSKRVLKSGIEFEKEIGTAAYRAPQIIRSEKYSDKCDIWSLGVVLYYILIGSTPWGNENATLYQIDKILKENPDLDGLISAAFIGKALGKDTINLIKRMLVIDESKRISWQELKKDFDLPEVLTDSKSHCVNPGNNYKISCKILNSVQHATGKKTLSFGQNVALFEELQLTSDAGQRIFEGLALSAESDVDEEEMKINGNIIRNHSSLDDSQCKWDMIGCSTGIEQEEGEYKEILGGIQLKQRINEGVDICKIIDDIISILAQYSEELGVKMIFLWTLQVLLRKFSNFLLLNNIQELDELKFLFNKTSELLELRKFNIDHLQRNKELGDPIKKKVIDSLVHLINNGVEFFLEEKYKINEGFIEELLSDCIKNKQIFKEMLVEMFQKFLKTLKEKIVKGKCEMDDIKEQYNKGTKIEEINKLLKVYQKILKLIKFQENDYDFKDQKEEWEEKTIEKMIFDLGLLDY